MNTLYNTTEQTEKGNRRASTLASSNFFLLISMHMSLVDYLTSDDKFPKC